jgi:hypothetical protein
MSVERAAVTEVVQTFFGQADSRWEELLEDRDVPLRGGPPGGHVGGRARVHAVFEVGTRALLAAVRGEEF